MHGFFGSDTWSKFGVQAVEWTIERILTSMQSGQEVDGKSQEHEVKEASPVALSQEES